MNGRKVPTVPRLSDFPPDEREAIVAAIAAKRAAKAVKEARAAKP
jgi:hypothetical protein